MKSYMVHYMNKYPGGSVRTSDQAVDVYNKDGEHVVALRKNGAGQWADCSEEYGLRDRHDLAPIPKDARVYKVKDNKIAEDELAAERKAALPAFLDGDKVLSMADLKAKGFRFDDQGRVVEAPKA